MTVRITIVSKPVKDLGLTAKKSAVETRRSVRVRFTPNTLDTNQYAVMNTSACGAGKFTTRPGLKRTKSALGTMNDMRYTQIFYEGQALGNPLE